MNLRGLTVSVGYADLLARGLSRWRDGFNRMLVVTSPGDHATLQVCRENGVETFVTDVFYAGGAKFNKGAALSRAVHATGWRTGAEWLCAFDADIVPADRWRRQLEVPGLANGLLYGARRWEVSETATLEEIDKVLAPRPPQPQSRRLVPSRRPANPADGSMPQTWVLGFFTLFHAGDRHLPADGEPLFAMDYPHAGSYDTDFSNRWNRQSQQVILPGFRTAHLGAERVNWFGRGKKEELYERCLGPAALASYQQWKKMPDPPALAD